MKDKLKSIVFLATPFLFAWFVWFYWMDPATYWQKLVSLTGSIITIVGIFRIQVEIF